MNVAVFASGGGTDFQALADASRAKDLGWKVVLLITNNPQAGALERAQKLGIPWKCISRDDFPSGADFLQALLAELEAYSADFIALAGYLRKIPPALIRKFHRRIVNIHPALLPAFGGKGMFGASVHQAVLDSGCKISGVTVHLVDEEYDRGPIIAQRAVPVEDDDDPANLARRVLKTEHILYPEVLTWFARGWVKFDGNKVKIVKPYDAI